MGWLIVFGWFGLLSVLYWVFLLFTEGTDKQQDNFIFTVKVIVVVFFLVVITVGAALFGGG